MVTTSNLVANVTAVVTQVDIKSATVTWQNVQAAIYLNYNSINQTFTDEATLTESFASLFSKAVIDSFSITDSANIQSDKVFTDSISFSDAEVITMNWGVAITDSVSVLDTVLDEYRDGPILNEFILNSECLLSRPITAPNVIITVI